MPEPLTVGSTFTGIGGADLGFEWAGFDIKWQCEYDSWKQEVLRAHWPDVPLYADITTMSEAPSVDVMLGGFPCQDLSVAGKRKGFSGERSVLAFEFLRVAELVQPRWIVLENVPGLLSSNGGRDFARLVDEVVGCGYGVAWRILDARYFGVPQRRRRVFIVARRTDAKHDSRGASRLALRALFESSGGDTSSGWQAWTETTRSVRSSSPSGSGIAGSLTKRYAKGINTTCDDGAMVFESKDKMTDGGGQLGCSAFRKSRRAASMTDDETWVDGDHANTLNRFDVGDTRTTHIVLKAQGYSIREDNAANTFSATPVDTARCLQKHQPSVQSHHAQTFIAETYPINDARPVEKHQNGTGIGSEGAPAYTLDRQQHPAVVQPERMTVRRLTPTECERLMGLPDGWTAPPGVKAPDSKRYAACGDAIVTTVAFWIADRIRMIEEEEKAS
jgi:DNA (cytosine-5)-methyltransferase 1